MTNNHRWRGASGSIRNRKIIEKIIQNRQKKIGSKPKTASKTVKTDEFSHTSYQNFNRSDIVVTSRAYRGFAAIQSRWLCIIAVQEGKTENHIGYKIRKLISVMFLRIPETKCFKTETL